MSKYFLGTVIFFVLFSLVVSLPSQAQSKKGTQKDEGLSLQNTKWVLSRTQIDGRLMVPGNSRVFEYTFTDSTISGASFCNNFDFRFKLVGKDSVKLYNFNPTMKTCNPATMSNERELIDNLRLVNRYKIESGGERLKLYINKETVAVFNLLDDDITDDKPAANPKSGN